MLVNLFFGGRTGVDPVYARLKEVLASILCLDKPFDVASVDELHALIVEIELS
jgi:hypothetical protein